MKMILKSALITAAMAGAATIGVEPANAGVTVGIAVPGVAVGFGGPGYAAYDNDYYYAPIYVSGSWYHGPYRWRMHNGERFFWVNGHWVRNEWRGDSYPASIVFTNGGYYRDGRYDGFGDAGRFNARFNDYDRDRHDNNRGWRHDRRNTQQHYYHDQYRDRDDNRDHDNNYDRQ